MKDIPLEIVKIEKASDIQPPLEPIQSHLSGFISTQAHEKSKERRSHE